jgi:hypothetical protein
LFSHLNKSEFSEKKVTLLPLFILGKVNKISYKFLTLILVQQTRPTNIENLSEKTDITATIKMKVNIDSIKLKERNQEKMMNILIDGLEGSFD